MKVSTFEVFNLIMFSDALRLQTRFNISLFHFCIGFQLFDYVEGVKNVHRMNEPDSKLSHLWNNFCLADNDSKEVIIA